MFGVSEQRKIAFCLVGGLIIMSVGCISSTLIAMGAPRSGISGIGLIVIGFTSILFFLGIGLVAYAGWAGYSNTFGDDKKKPQRIEQMALIMNILVLDLKHEPVFDPDMYDPSELKYLVQIQLANGQKIELETHPMVLQTMGEGMRGTIVYQGKWLSRFDRVLGR